MTEVEFLVKITFSNVEMFVFNIVKLHMSCLFDLQAVFLI